MTPADDPHHGCAITRAGPRAAEARGGLVLVHGRGGTAGDICGLAAMLGAADVAVAAPQAAGQSWWPVSFLAPMPLLEPWLGSALAAVGRAVASLEDDGIARPDIAIAGFSQGACLALEYAARTGGPWRAVLGFSGGLVGYAEAGGPALAALYGHADKLLGNPATRLDGVPVYIGCHAQDPHIPAQRVTASADALRAMGADVTARLHPGAGHGLTDADIAAGTAALATPPTGTRQS